MIFMTRLIHLRNVSYVKQNSSVKFWELKKLRVVSHYLLGIIFSLQIYYENKIKDRDVWRSFIYKS